MSPKIFEYKGIVLKFFSDEHSPIHVHAIYNEYQMKVEFYIKDKKIRKIEYKAIRGYKKFPNNKLIDLRKLISEKKNHIITEWIKFYIYNEKIKSKKITKKIR